MRQLLLIILGCLLSMHVLAFDSTGNSFKKLATTGTSVGTSGSLSSKASKRHKIIQQAQNDAAVFVGSRGGVKGVYLEMAFEHLRQTDPTVRNASDIELAEAILAY